MLTRTDLHQSLRTQRAQLSAAAQKSASDRIANQISTCKIFNSSLHIAAYAACSGEIDLSALIKLRQAQSKQWYLPVMGTQKKLTFVRYTLDEVLLPNLQGIEEPTLQVDKVRSPEALDLILVPLVAFDLHGNRLGMGGGYYDRTFAFLANTATRPSKPFLMGIAYAWQCCNALEPAVWDIPLDAVATPEQLHYFHA